MYIYIYIIFYSVKEKGKFESKILFPYLYFAEKNPFLSLSRTYIEISPLSKMLSM